MGLLEGLLYMLWRGVAIGVIISAPMGPVGILCIQRTLEKGRRTGFYTGVGAALSDLVYCLLTGFGLSFIEEFLERNSNVIQLFGSIVLIGFGIYLFRTNPSKKLKRPSEKGIPAGKNILSGFLFTFSNPLIIFLIIGLFARFNFLLPEIKIYHYLLGFVSIIGGALAWWWIVTYSVDKVRAHFNLRSMWLINKIIGSVILLFAIVGIFNAAMGIANAAERAPSGSSVYMGDIINISNNGSGIKCNSLDIGGMRDFDMKFRIRNLRNAENKRYKFEDSSGTSGYNLHPCWGVNFGNGDTMVSVSVKTASNPLDALTYEPSITHTLRRGDEILADCASTAGFNIFEGLNAYRIRVKDGKLTIWGGNREYKVIFTDVKLDNVFDEFSFFVEPGGEIQIEHLDIKTLDSDNPGDDSIEESELPDIETLKETFRHSKDGIEGLWGLLDYSADDSYLKVGGEYTVAIIAAGNDVENAGEYNIYYVSGAIKYPSKWEYGSVKGLLKPTMFPNLYNMKWVSANGNEIKKSIKVEFDTRDMLINVPEYSSTLRFRKIYPENKE